MFTEYEQVNNFWIVHQFINSSVIYIFWLALMKWLWLMRRWGGSMIYIEPSLSHWTVVMKKLFSTLGATIFHYAVAIEFSVSKILSRSRKCNHNKILRTLRYILSHIATSKSINGARTLTILTILTIPCVVYVYIWLNKNVYCLQKFVFFFFY